MRRMLLFLLRHAELEFQSHLLRNTLQGLFTALHTHAWAANASHAFKQLLRCVCCPHGRAGPWRMAGSSARARSYLSTSARYGALIWRAPKQPAGPISVATAAQDSDSSAGQRATDSKQQAASQAAVGDSPALTSQSLLAAGCSITQHQPLRSQLQLTSRTVSLC